MSDKYDIENNELIKWYLDNTFFKSWKEKSRTTTTKLRNLSFLEMDFGYKCDLNCQYCYYHKYGKQLYQNEEINIDNMLKNMDSLMAFIAKNKMTPELEFFSGETFVIPQIFDIFDIIYKYQKDVDLNDRVETISIPTNLSFLKEGNEDLLRKVKEYIEKFKQINIHLALSGSFDGIFMDSFNRPVSLRHDYSYSKVFYERVVEELPNMRFGLHPMIYSNNIEYWIENFIWFLNTFGPNFYLLEVRNTEWSKEQVKNLKYLMRTIVNILYKFYLTHYDNNEPFHIFLTNIMGLNIITSPFGIIGRGIGCSIQSTFNLTMHNLSLVPCHRLGYENLIIGKFKFNKDGTYEFYSEHPEIFLAIQGTVTDKLPVCEHCPINKLCSGPCLGSSYESLGEMFVPNPAVCRMEHSKILGILQGLNDVGELDYYLNTIDEVRKSQALNLLNMGEKF